MNHISKQGFDTINFMFFSLGISFSAAFNCTSFDESKSASTKHTAKILISLFRLIGFSITHHNIYLPNIRNSTVSANKICLADVFIPMFRKFIKRVEF